MASLPGRRMASANGMALGLTTTLKRRNMPRANATNGMSPNLMFTSGVTPPGLPMSIEAVSRTRPELQNRHGWNQPFCRNKQAFGEIAFLHSTRVSEAPRQNPAQ
jgi:hypothetical protein